MLKVLWIDKATHFDIAEALNLPAEEVSDLLCCILGRNEPAKVPKQEPLRIVSVAAATSEAVTLKESYREFGQHPSVSDSCVTK